MRPIHSLAPLLLSLVLGSCEDTDCGMFACKAMQKLAPENGETRLAGALAYLDDQGRAGACASCSQVGAELQVWKVPSREILDSEDWPVLKTEEAQQWIVSGPPLVTVRAKKTFSLPVEQGNYLICMFMGCVEVRVSAAGTHTLNLLAGPGVGAVRGHFAAPGETTHVLLEGVGAPIYLDIF